MAEWTRRKALGVLGGTATALGIGARRGSAETEECAVAPSETAGPFASRTDLVRRDIREDREGLSLTLAITVVNARASCRPVAGATVDVWHCDALGRYSEYAQPGYDGRGATFLRGLQKTDADGKATFVTVYPGWYPGRATHIHVEVTKDGRTSKVTQIAFPEDANAAVYGTGVYAARGSNPTSNARDGLFADSLDAQIAALNGSPVSGYTAAFQLGIAL
jgi:protocatechuate 3,4-dioxygenase beta subunit